MRDHLMHRNNGQVHIRSRVISTRTSGTNQEFLFRLAEASFPFGKPVYFLSSELYRVLAFNAELPLLPAGFLDYRIVDPESSPSSVVIDKTHNSNARDRVAIKVERETREKFRGIGRAMASIAFTHAASLGVTDVYIHNALAPRFFRDLGAREIEFFHDDVGTVPVEQIASMRGVSVNMQMRITNIPCIQVTLRSEPIQTLIHAQ